MAAKPTLTAYADEASWLEARNPFITGSRAAAALGLGNPRWGSPIALYLEMRGEAEAWEGSERAEWGQRLEPVIADAYAEREQRQLFDLGRFTLLVNAEFPWAAATLDRLDVTEASASSPAEALDVASSIVEVKCVDPRNMSDWTEDELPDQYSLQAHHQLLVTGKPFVVFAVLVGGNELRTFTVNRDDTLLADLAEAEFKFAEMVRNGTPPEIDGSAATKSALTDYFHAKAGATVELDPSLRATLELLEAAKAEVKFHEERRTKYENEIKMALGENEIGTIDGDVAVTWKLQERKEHFVKASTARPLLPKKLKGA